jgi:hypothetical protein
MTGFPGDSGLWDKTKGNDDEAQLGGLARMPGRVLRPLFVFCRFNTCVQICP